MEKKEVKKTKTKTDWLPLCTCTYLCEPFVDFEDLEVSHRLKQMYVLMDHVWDPKNHCITLLGLLHLYFSSV